MAVHFIGFRGDEYHRATKVWGQPDFVHKWHDCRIYGDVDSNKDTLVFANKDTPETINQYSWQDHEKW